MSALDQVNRLKEERRAELAAAEAARVTAEEQARRESAERLTLAIWAAFKDEHCDWLYEFRTGEPNYRQRQLVAEVRFEVPGHREIWLNLIREDGTRGNWIPSNGGDDVPSRWTAISANEHGTYVEHHDWLADALISAEIEGWTPPAPPEPTPTPEAEQKAAEAWALMFAHGMPPHIALGFVEEVTDGDVPTALYALLTAAAVAVGNSRPSVVLGLEGSFADADAGILTGKILRQDFAAAEVYRSSVVLRMCELEALGQGEYAGPWLDWCSETQRAMGLCVKLCQAAQAGAAAA